ncbi:MAG TPA: class I SAM-dependent methyltransferase [Nitrososphaeraceae archaeon]|nr:class I SAM-dependent methyltransferase [Nitrososphaeraceae archaeon]
MTSRERKKDEWNSGARYESYMGRWSRLVAHQFVVWLNVSADAQWLDVGCGTGNLCQTILDIASPDKVLGIDSSEEYIEFAREKINDTRAAFCLGDAQVLPVETASYDVAVSGLVLNFVSHPSQMLREMIRAVRGGGTVAAYVWDYADQMQLTRYFWNAAVELNRTETFSLDEGQRFPICRPEPLRQLFQIANQLGNVEVRSIDVVTPFRNFDDYWSPFLGGQGPAPGYAISLSEEKRVALREHIRRMLPTSTDGSIQLMARAWAIRGVHQD